MKRLLTSKSGMTLIEIIIALVFLIIIVVAFTTVFTFTGSTVIIAGRDAGSNAEASSEANSLLSTPANPASVTIKASIDWSGDRGVIKQDVTVVHESVSVPDTRGQDIEINIYRRAPQDEPEIPEPQQP